jgi:hypothetical protein
LPLYRLRQDRSGGSRRCGDVKKQLNVFQSFKPFNRCAPFKPLNPSHVPTVATAKV